VIGRTVGNYVVKEKIGEGGMGAVYLAEHPRIHRLVAIKVLLPEYSKNPQVVARFFNEAKAANEIHNDHIIDIIDFGELADSGSYIIMEWLDGKSLSASLAQGAFGVARAVHVARGIGRALAAAHASGIVHRDLKPDNIFLVTRNEDPDFVKVLDFGIAKLMQPETAAGPDVKTKTGSLIGTPSYMSPEQCRGAVVDHRTDIYALGVLLYQMLTGELPFRAEGLGELLLQHMTVAPRPLRELRAEIPQPVERAVLKALEKNPEQRFQTVDALLEALDGVLTGKHAVAAERPTLPGNAAPQNNQDTLGNAAAEAVSSTVSRKRPGAIIGVASLLAAAAVAAFAVVHYRGAGATDVPAPAPNPPTASTPNPPAANLPAPNLPTANAPAPQPTPPAPVPPPTAPQTARVKISVAPASATVLLDDTKLTTPFDGSFQRGDVRHHLVVSAPGYRTEGQWVTFDADRAIEVKLARGSGSTDRKPPRPAPQPQPQPQPQPDDKTPVYKGTKPPLITNYPQ